MDKITERDKNIATDTVQNVIRVLSCDIPDLLEQIKCRGNQDRDKIFLNGYLEAIRIVKGISIHAIE